MERFNALNEIFKNYSRLFDSRIESVIGDYFLAERHFRKLKASKGKGLIWFEDTGHFFMHEKNREFQRISIDSALDKTP